MQATNTSLARKNQQLRAQLASSRGPGQPPASNTYKGNNFNPNYNLQQQQNYSQPQGQPSPTEGATTTPTSSIPIAGRTVVGGCRATRAGGAMAAGDRGGKAAATHPTKLAQHPTPALGQPQQPSRSPTRVTRQTLTTQQTTAVHTAVRVG